MVFVSRIGLRVPSRKFGDFGEGLLAVLPHEEIAPVRERGEKRWIFGVYLVSETLQLEVLDDALLQQAGQVRSGGNMIAGPDFFGDGASAGKLATLEQQDAPPSASQVCRCHQPVVAGADDDDVKPHRSPSMTW